MSEESIRQEELERQIQEELKTLEVLEGKSPDAKEEEQVTTIKEEKPKYTEVELSQMEKGWDPEYQGSNKVSAEEFKRVGEIIDAKRAANKQADAANREVVELTKTVKQLVEHNKAIAKAAEDERRVALAKARLDKISEGDIDSVLRIEQEQHQLSNVPPTIPEVKPESPEVAAFQARHKDFLTGTTPEDKAMQDYVGYRVYQFMKETPDIDEKVAIQSIEEGLSKQFPHRFENPNKSKPAMVGSSTTSSSVALTPLPFEHRATLAQIQKVDPSFTAEEFTKQLKTLGKI